MAKAQIKKDAKVKQDVIVNRILLVLAVCIISIAFLMYLYNSFLNPSVIPYMHSVQIALIVIDILFIVFSVIWYIKKHSQKVNETYKTIRSGSLLATSIIIFPIVLAIYFYGIVAIRALYVLIPAYFVLYIIYVIHQREFFWLCLLAFVFGGGFWVVYKFNNFTETMKYIQPILTALIVIAVAAAVVLMLIKKAGGCLKAGRIKLRFSTKNVIYILLLILFALAIACACITFAVGPIVAYYSMFAISAYIIFSAIFYSVKLMVK